MKKRASLRAFQKFVLFIFGTIFLIFSTLLYNNQDDINHHSNIAAMLSFGQENATKMQDDIYHLQQYIKSQASNSLTRYVKDNLTNHKKWLTELLTGAGKNDPLAIFGIKYLSLLAKLPVNGDVGLPPTHRKLLRLAEDFSQPDINIVVLSQQRMLANLDQLNGSIILSNIILLCLIFTFFVLLTFGYWSFSAQVKLAYKYRRLSLYFIDHPNVLLRLSPNSRIKYFNKQAELLMSQKKIGKYKLLPSNIASLVSQAIEYSEQTIRYQHQVAQHTMDCEIRFCKTSQQIFLTMIDSQQATGAKTPTLPARQAM